MYTYSTVSRAVTWLTVYRALQVVFLCVHFLYAAVLWLMRRNAAASAFHLEELMQRLDIRDHALISVHMNLLNSPPHGNLVDGLPRAASFVSRITITHEIEHDC